MKDQRIPFPVDVCAQCRQQLHSRSKAVAFLQAQPSAVRNAAFAHRLGTGECQHRHNVRNVPPGKDDPMQGCFRRHQPLRRFRKACAKLVQHGQRRAVALGGIQRQPRRCDGMSQRARTQQHGPLAPVPGQGGILRAILLIARNAPLPRPDLLQHDAAFPQALQRHVDIPGGFHWRRDRQGRSVRQQRQGIEHARHKLAGHVARQGIIPGPKASAQGQRFPAAGLGNAAGCENGIIGCEGTFTEPSVHMEAAAFARRQRNRHHKAQGRAAFPTVHAGSKVRASRHAADGHGIALHSETRPQRRQAIHGGGHVLRGHEPRQLRFPCRQRRADQPPMGFALRGRHLRRP